MALSRWQLHTICNHLITVSYIKRGEKAATAPSHDIASVQSAFGKGASQQRPSGPGEFLPSTDTRPHPTAGRGFRRTRARGNCDLPLTFLLTLRGPQTRFTVEARHGNPAHPARVRPPHPAAARSPGRRRGRGSAAGLRG